MSATPVIFLKASPEAITIMIDMSTFDVYEIFIFPVFGLSMLVSAIFGVLRRCWNFSGDTF